MSLDSIQLRIAQIRQLTAPPAPAAALATRAASFATALDDAMRAGAPGSARSVGAPAELAKYGNGRVPLAALEPVGIGSHRLWAPAATSFQEMIAAADAAGVKIGITDSYRSYDQQVALAGRKGLYKNGGLAATPGTSNHGWGRSVDLDLSPTAQAWMRRHGAEFGFVEDVPREPWHWTFQGAA
ncbi:MAG TPA: M15 family metallopeptidase [Acidimicrobiales bacterium]|nr:M15 family metallopeptidase [Acidimicrobiales bacterium]